MNNINWDNVKEVQEFEQVKPGGYICGITKVEDVPDKEYLMIEYDIIEGKYKGYYKSLFDAKAFWVGRFIKSYKEKALPFFKAFKTAVELSNPGYIFMNDPHSLRGKKVGLVLAEEEYISNTGEVKTRLYVAQIRAVKAIKDGDFTVPQLKKLKEDNTSSPSVNVNNTDVNDDDEYPF